MAYLIVIAVFVVAVAAIGYACFVAGWHTGWTERHASMILPEHTMQRIDAEARWRP